MSFYNGDRDQWIRRNRNAVIGGLSNGHSQSTSETLSVCYRYEISLLSIVGGNSGGKRVPPRRHQHFGSRSEFEGFGGRGRSARRKETSHEQKVGKKEGAERMKWKITIKYQGRNRFLLEIVFCTSFFYFFYYHYFIFRWTYIFVLFSRPSRGPFLDGRRQSRLLCRSVRHIFLRVSFSYVALSR